MQSDAGAAHIGGLVGGAAAVLLALALAAAAAGAAGLLAAVLAGAAPVTWAAVTIGRRLGPRLRDRGPGGAAALGVLGGLLCQVAAALTAAALGLLWGLADRATDGPAFLWSYLGKPASAVLLYGLQIALVLGAAAGLLIRALSRRPAAPPP